MEQSIAGTIAGVSADNVVITVSAASVLLDIVVTVPAGILDNFVLDSMTSSLGDVAGASSLLGATVTAATLPAVMTTLATKPSTWLDSPPPMVMPSPAPPPSPPPSPAPPSPPPPPPPFSPPENCYLMIAGFGHSGSRALKNTQMIDCTGGSLDSSGWMKGPDTTYKHFNGATVAVGNWVYAMGGGNGPNGGDYTLKVEKFDVSTCTALSTGSCSTNACPGVSWTNVADMPGEGLSSLSAAVVDAKIFTFGGYGQSSGGLSAIHMFDTNGDGSWVTLPPLTVIASSGGNMYMGTFGLAGKGFYVVNGHSQISGNWDTTWKYDTTDSQCLLSGGGSTGSACWSEVASPIKAAGTAGGSFGFECSDLNGKGYCVGGGLSAVYDPDVGSTGTWTTTLSTPTDGYHGGTATVPPGEPPPCPASRAPQATPACPGLACGASLCSVALTSPAHAQEGTAPPPLTTTSHHLIPPQHPAPVESWPPTQLQTVACAAGKVVFTGPGGAATNKGVQVYDTVAQSWSVKPDMCDQQSYHQVARAQWAA